MQPETTIRAEQPGDRDAIFTLNAAAFDTDAEARLVDVLRERMPVYLSLVAEQEGTLVGHILFTPVTLSGHPDRQILGLAPMAVAPDHQRQGIGAALIEAGLAACREAGAGAVTVLGHPDYYPRFGFHIASDRGISCEFDVPAEAFMVVELVPGFLDGMSGTIVYDAAFREV